MIFGIGTQANNAIPGGATVYGIDLSGNFASAQYHGVTYTTANSMGSFLDSGSNALYILDPVTLTSATGINTVDCADNGYYCPNSTLSLPITLAGTNGTSGVVTLSIANADTLFSANTNNAAFANLGGDSGGTGLATDYLDLGMPFFFGRTVVTGISGTSSTNPNGYWAF